MIKGGQSSWTLYIATQNLKSATVSVGFVYRIYLNIAIYGIVLCKTPYCGARSRYEFRICLANNSQWVSRLFNLNSRFDKNNNSTRVWSYKSLRTIGVIHVWGNNYLKWNTGTNINVGYLYGLSKRTIAARIMTHS